MQQPSPLPVRYSYLKVDLEILLGDQHLGIAALEADGAVHQLAERGEGPVLHIGRVVPGVVFHDSHDVQDTCPLDREACKTNFR